MNANLEFNYCSLSSRIINVNNTDHGSGNKVEETTIREWFYDRVLI